MKASVSRSAALALLLLTAVLLLVAPGTVSALETAAAPPTTTGSRETTAAKESSSTGKPAQTISAKDVTKTLGAKAFSLKAKVTSGKASERGALSYKSKNKTVATVTSKGKVTVKNVGKAEIVITAKATKKYKKTQKSITVTVNPKGTSITKVSPVAGKMLLVTVKKRTGVSGYELRYATSASMKNAKIVRAEGVSYLAKSIRDLKVGKTYYVQVRTYKKVKGTDYFSKWSKSKTGVPKSTKTGY